MYIVYNVPRGKVSNILRDDDIILSENLHMNVSHFEWFPR